MAIYPRLMGILVHDTVVLRCRDCNAPTQEAQAENILIVCSNCARPLAEWDTTEERAAEMANFENLVRAHLGPRPTARRRKYSTKNESKSKSMTHGGGGGRKRTRKNGRKRGHK